MDDVYRLHKAKLDSILKEELRLPALKAELTAVVGEMEFAGIIRQKINEIRAREIRSEISRISTEREKYYLTGVPLMYKAKNSADDYTIFRSLVDPNYAATIRSTINDDNYCYACERFRVVPSDGIAVCPECHSQVYVEIFPKNIAPTAAIGYQRIDYLRRWLEQIQGKESFEIPKNVIDIVRTELNGNTTANESDVVRYLKKHKLKLYNHSTKILCMATGKAQPQMTREMEYNIEDLFMSIQDSFDRHKGTRKKFFSYAYILYKLCELLGYTKFLSKLTMHKNRKLVRSQDTIWREVCKDVGLEFIETC